MRERRIHQALVVDENGRIEGMITLEDVLAELIGGVSDEFKGATARPILLPDGSVRLPGTMRLEQAAQVVGAAVARRGRHRQLVHPQSRSAARPRRANT